MTIITPALCRAARALLDWTQDDLAREAKVSVNTIRNYEGAKVSSIHSNLAALQATLEAAGVVFIPRNGGGGEGVRMRK